MQVHGVHIQDTFAEGFRVWATRLMVTAADHHWLQAAIHSVTGYATSVIACDVEAGVEQYLTPAQTPDGRCGASLLFFSFKPEPLAKAVANRVGQCLLTCPTSAVYDGLPDAMPGDDSARFDLGKILRFFGDGYQKSKVIAGKRYWRVPVMDGEFTVIESLGAIKAVAGGNFLLCGADQATTLSAARAAIEAIAPLPGVITPFPGGVVRSGSKVGSRYKGMVASTNHPFCPTLRHAATTALPPQARCVYEIVINGISFDAIAQAMTAGIHAACQFPLLAISAGNYGGKLGKFHFYLRQLPPPPSSKNIHKLDIATPQEDPRLTQPGYTLTWKTERQNAFALVPPDGSFLRPDILAKLSLDELSAYPLAIGRQQVALGALFDISGQPGLRLTIQNLPPLARIGAGMADGCLILQGDVGDDLGASMSGGIILVHGHAGHRAGGPDQAKDRGMSGGEIIIQGNVGDHAGFRMRRGLMAFTGRCGASPGYRMLAGTLVIGSGPVDHPGLEMRRGSIFLLDGRQPIPTLPYWQDCGQIDPATTPFLSLLGRRLQQLGFANSLIHPGVIWQLWSGDRTELNRGEIWQCKL